jgi:DNA-binding response OmpR family regulator
MDERKVILVVEDDAAVRQLVVRSLSTQYIVREASDGLAAAELLGQLEHLDLVVLDVMMPKVDGISLAKMMKADKKLAKVPILFVSAKDAPEDVVKGIGAGARHYITKPFGVKDFLERVGRILGEAPAKG